ncbi:MAG: cytochrome c oxidase subunit 3 [Mycobacterium sp.]
MTNTEPTAVTAGPRAPADEQHGEMHLPGDGHMWFMVLGDLIIFGAYFIVYMVQRAMAPAAYLLAQQHLSITIGVLNTLVLVTSSWFVAQAVGATAIANYERAIRLIYGGGACGVLFIAIKAYEWMMKITQGYTTSNEFFMFYYMLTGVHVFHVALGILILGIVVRELRNPRRRRLSMVEQGATYWHMVDLLWLVIFGLLYVMR